MEGKSDVELSRNKDCDIEILVGESVFNAHRVLLDRCSMYFHEKLKKEYEFEQKVQLDTSKVGMEWCLEYMYSNSCPPDKHRNTEDITVLKKVLQTSQLLRIHEVQTKIQDHLLRQMKDSDGLEILKFLREYGTDSYIKKVREFVKDNIHVVITQKEFLEIDSDDFIYYIHGSEASMEITWKGIDSWMRFHKEQESLFYKALDIMLGTRKDITSVGLLVDVFKSDYVQNDQQCQKRVLRELESRKETIIDTLDTNSSIQLLTVLKGACYTGELPSLRKAAVRHIAENMMISNADYHQLEFEDLSEILDVASSTATAEQKWKIIKNWIEHKIIRKIFLVDALKALLSEGDIMSILFDLFEYPLIKEDQKCKECILHTMESHEKKLSGELDANLSIKLLCLFRTNDCSQDKFSKLREAAIQVLVRKVKETSIDYQELHFEDFYKILKRHTPTITNQDKWKRIVPWIRHSESRGCHALALIKTMDPTKLKSKFISNSMKQEPFVKYSTECLNYLLDLQLGNAVRPWNEGKHVDGDNSVSTLAILNDNTPKLSLVNPRGRKRANVTIPNVSSCARIASLCGDLYILCDKELFQLKQDGSWKSVLQHLKYSDSWIQLTVFEDKLAIITKNTTMIYSPTHNEAKQNVGCELGNGFSSAGSHDCLFAVGGKFSGDKAKQYRLSENKWKNLPEMPMLWSYSASVYYRDKLYVMGGSWLSFRSSSVICLDGTAWIKMNSMIHSRSRFAAVVYDDKILVLGGTGELFKKTESVEQYCEGQWKEAGRTEQLHGVISLAQCQINESDIQFRSSDYGINITSPLRRINTTRT